MRDMRQWAAATGLGICLLGGAWPSHALDPIPGWDQARWGMSVEEVRGLYPDLVAPEPKPADSDLKLETHRLLNRSFAGVLEGCDLKFRFMNERLWEILFACKAYKAADVRRVLEERYGFPQQDDLRQAVWRGEITRISLNSLSGWFSVSSVERGEWLTAEVLRRVRQPQVQKPIPPAPGPVPESLSPKEDPTEPAALDFECHRLPTGGTSPYGVLVGDFNGDSRPDLAMTNSGSGTVTIRLGMEGARFGDPRPVRVARVPRDLAAGDVDGDGDLDLVVGHANPNSTWVLLGNGKGEFELSKTYISGDSPFGIGLEDLDGDGHLDLFVANEDNSFAVGRGRVAVHSGQGTGLFSEAQILEAGLFPSGIAAADLDGTGGVDLAVVNWGSSSLVVFLQREAGFVRARELHPGLLGTYAIWAADLDRDGHVDLAISNVPGRVVVLFGEGNATFADPIIVPMGSGNRWVTSADVDGDGRLDLITADATDGTVSVALGREARSFREREAFKVGRVARMVRAADFDGDGRLDLVVSVQGEDDVAILLQRDPGQGRECPASAKSSASR
ncbi:MAG: VCBS repeat-containing protein [Myxococcota bacterium]